MTGKKNSFESKVDRDTLHLNMCLSNFRLIKYDYNIEVYLNWKLVQF
jgi:hypothetical protein